jgi:hypothetical protein
MDPVKQDTNDNNQSPVNPQPTPIVPEKGLEGGFTIAPETTEYAYVPEVEKPVETEPSPETQETFVPLAGVVKHPEPAPQPIVVQPTQTEQKPNIVDKTSQPTNLHHIQHPHDKITDLADREEEEFIKDVAAAHHDHEHQ